jgi:hypothetical protein
MDAIQESQLTGAASPDGVAVPSVVVQDLIAAVGSIRPCANSAGLIEQLRGLEDLKSAIAGLQARVAVAFDGLERSAQAEKGMRASEQSQGIAHQIALARRESPARGSRLLGLARALVTEMPHTLAALDTGQLNEWRAILLVKETACLSAADRCAVDEELSADAGTFTGAGDRAVIAAARAASYRRDRDPAHHDRPHALSGRQRTGPPCRLRRRARWLGQGGRQSGTTPNHKGRWSRPYHRLQPECPQYLAPPAVYGSRHRRSHRHGLPGTALPGRAAPAYPGPGRHLPYALLRRPHPPPSATIRHHDHIVPWRSGGPTNLGNSAGLCEACNQTKEISGWNARPRPGPRQPIELTTPTGHSYYSTAPPLPGTNSNERLTPSKIPGLSSRHPHRRIRCAA